MQLGRNIIREAANGSDAVSDLAELDSQGRDVVDRLDILRMSLCCEHRVLFDRQLDRLLDLYQSSAT